MAMNNKMDQAHQAWQNASTGKKIGGASCFSCLGCLGIFVTFILILAGCGAIIGNSNKDSVQTPAVTSSSSVASPSASPSESPSPTPTQTPSSTSAAPRPTVESTSPAPSPTPEKAQEEVTPPVEEATEPEEITYAPQPLYQQPAEEEAVEEQAPLYEAPVSTNFGSCAEARAAGAAPLYEGQPGYSPKLDRDHDGVACEN